MDQYHLHLVLNHLPIIGGFFSGLALLYGLVRKNEEVQNLSLLGFIFCALATAPVYFTGEAAEEVVEHLPGILESLVEAHEDFAKFAALGMGFTGLLAAAALGHYLLKKAHVQLLLLSLSLIWLVDMGLMIRTGYLGGQIRHGQTVQQTIPFSQSTSDHHHDDDD